MGSNKHEEDQPSPRIALFNSSQKTPQPSSDTKGIYKDKNGQLYELKPITMIDMDCVDQVSSESSSSSSDLDKRLQTDEGEADDLSSEGYNCVHHMQTCTSQTISTHKAGLVRLIYLLVFVGYTIYFGFAIAYDLDMAVALIVCTGLVILVIVYGFIRDHFGDAIYTNCIKPVSEGISSRWEVIKWFWYPALIIAVILYLALVVVQEVKQLQSLSGFVIFILVMYLTSKHPNKIIWRPVIWGFFLQFLLAIFVLRWEYGYIGIKFLADEINKFIEYGYDGAAIVFGDPFLLLHPFVFMGMPLLIYLGSVMAILYHVGLTQKAALKLGWALQSTMGTTAIETLNTASNIFLDGMDTMLMLRHYIDKLTLSEFNCFLVGNHATVAGFVFALFVLFGAPPQHLLSAAVMSAPATIAICKLNYPETEESITKNLAEVKLAKGSDVNVFEAAANGCTIAAKTVGAVVSCYIAFMGLLSFLNATLSWLGGRVGYDELSFELICSYVMWPIALIIGIDIDECQQAAKLMGIKLFATEILAYQELGRSASEGLLNPRDQALTTYAMCGFSSISTLAIAVGVWNAICPQRVKLMASSMFRVLVEANISCFMTACVAGVFYSEDMIAMFELNEPSAGKQLLNWVRGLIPSYSQLMAIADF